MQEQRLGRWILGSALLASLVITAIGAYYRRPWSDEGDFSSASHTLAQHGYMGTVVLESSGTHFTRIEQRTYWVMPMFLLGQALWYQLFPASLFWTRMFTMLWHPLALAALWLFLSKLFPKSPIAPLAAGLLATGYIFMDNAGFARPDLMCCALGLWGLALYVRLRENHFLRALFFSNLCIAASGLTHPNGIFHLIALAILILWFDRSRVFSPGPLALAALPYLLLGAAWGLYILQDLPAWRDQLLANGTNGRWPASWSPVAILKAEALRYLTAFGARTRGFALLKLYALAAYFTAVAGCLLTGALRRSSAVRLLLVLLAAYFLGLSVFNQKLSYYLIHIVPVYASLLAVWLSWLWARYPRLHSVLALGVILLVAVEGGGILLRAHSRDYRPAQQAAMAFALAHTRPGDRIIGSASLLYEIQFDARLRDDPYLGLNSRRAGDAIVIDELYRILYDAWRTERPGDMRRIDGELARYSLAYQSAEYQIYLPSSGLIK